MNKEKIYLDTSVPSAYFDDRKPERMQTTHVFWHQALMEYELAVSSVTIFEITNTKDPDRRQQMLDLVEPLALFKMTPRTDELSLAYLSSNLVPPSKLEDARHLAIAVENGFNYLVSWNFSHMINAKTQRRLPIINAQHGYFRQLILVSPEAFQ